MSERSGSRAHLTQTFWIVKQSSHFPGQPVIGELGLRHENGGFCLRKDQRILVLMIVGGKRERNQQRRLPCSSEFRYGTAAAAEDQIRIGETRRHVIQKRSHL